MPYLKIQNPKPSAIQPSLARIASIRISRTIIEIKAYRSNPITSTADGTLQDKNTTPNQEKHLIYFI